MHGSPRQLLLGPVSGLHSMEFLQHPRQVVRQRAHGLHALDVLRGLALLAAIGDVPVLRRDDGHVHRLIDHVGSATPTDTVVGHGLVLEGPAWR